MLELFWIYIICGIISWIYWMYFYYEDGFVLDIITCLMLPICITGGPFTPIALYIYERI